MYSKVKTWQDLINTNISFIKGEIPETFYHGGPLDEETTNNKDFYDAILEMNEKGLFTDESQPYIKTNNSGQQSYVSFYVQISRAETLKNLLKEDDTIFFECVDYYNNTQYDNFEQEKYNLSYYILNENYDEKKLCGYVKNNIHCRTNWWRNINMDKDYFIKNKKINFLLDNSVHFMIVCKNDNLAPLVILKYIDFF